MSALVKLFTEFEVKVVVYLVDQIGVSGYPEYTLGFQRSESQQPVTQKR